jgi:hypothetical protein
MMSTSAMAPMSKRSPETFPFGPLHVPPEAFTQTTSDSFPHTFCRASSSVRKMPRMVRPFF